MKLIPDPRSLIPDPRSPIPDPRSLIPDPRSLIPDPRSLIPSSQGFTLIELLVVIGIIGILAGVLMATFGSATESARAAKCILNLRSLANAASAYAMEGNRENHYPTGGGYFPLAGSVETRYGTAGGALYGEFVGWISWLSSEEQYGKDSSGTTSHKTIEIPICSGTGDPKKNRFMLSHGSLWKAVGKTSDVYVCPTHRKRREEKHKSAPIFSYQMNAYFGYDKTMGTGDVGLPYEVESSIAKKSGALARADRTLLFAELGESSGEDIYPMDPVLNYKATVNGKEYGKDWNKTPETIGFVHPGKHGKKFAHVVFADGHTEKLSSGAKGLTYEQLTALLCEGEDIAFTGDGYQAIETGKIY